jgi:hypothetical protein
VPSRWARSWTDSGSSGSRNRSISALATRATTGSPRALDIALAGGEILDNRPRDRPLARGESTSSSPNRSSAAASPETLWIAELAAVHSIPAMPHTSNNAIGIAAAA